MKVHLMHGDRDVDVEGDLPATTGDLMQDLALDTLFGAMASGDGFLYDIAQRGVLLSLTDLDAIVYRQRVLADCLAHPGVTRALYDLSVEVIEGERKIYWGFFEDWPYGILKRSVSVLEFIVPRLEQLRHTADEYVSQFQSEGFTRFFATLQQELDDGYFGAVKAHLKELQLPQGILISASLGEGNRGEDYVLRRAPARGLMHRVLGDRDGYSFAVPDRDEPGHRALSELRDRGLNSTANALAQSVDHILSFFSALRVELGFYIGCLNVHDALAGRGGTCFPVPHPFGGDTLHAGELYDITLALNAGHPVVGNDLRADGKRLVMITGANQGGKSTCLRSVGLAQLMMQAGMFVAARSFEASLRSGLFTHYKREEDPTMASGKLDEELNRMSEIVNRIAAGSLLLCNESFAATNEREGSEIARQVVGALIEEDVTVLFVTHLHDLAHRLFLEGSAEMLFLRAERGEGGRRTYKLQEGEPLPTSYGEDTYRRIFGSVAMST